MARELSAVSYAVGSAHAIATATVDAVSMTMRLYWLYRGPLRCMTL